MRSQVDEYFTKQFFEPLTQCMENIRLWKTTNRIQQCLYPRFYLCCLIFIEGVLKSNDSGLNLFPDPFSHLGPLVAILDLSSSGKFQVVQHSRQWASEPSTVMLIFDMRTNKTKWNWSLLSSILKGKVDKQCLSKIKL